jgi:hypothetical protein
VDALDKIAGSFKNMNASQNVDFKMAFKSALEGEVPNGGGTKVMDALANLQKSTSGSVRMELKVVGDMTIATNLTGNGVITYNSRQALVPAQKLNFRDLIPATMSPTLEYVTFKETGTEGSISVQTEGSSKTQIDYDLTNVRIIQSYLAGFARFTKQMLKSLPWLSGTLPRLLLRDFYKAENASFYATAVAAATVYQPGTLPTDDVEAIITAIANFESTDFTASFGIVSKQQWGRLAISTYNKGYYGGAGSVVITPGGQITIAGVPILSASWATDDKILLIDVDYIERVEGESLNIQFSYEDADNFTKNKVTARVECLEVLNIMRPDALQITDFGNVTP